MSYGMITAMLRRLLPLLIISLILAACGPERLPEQVVVNLTSDGETRELLLPQGSTVRDALRSASLTLAELDRVRPPETTLLVSGMGITVTRVIQTTEIVTRTRSYPTGQTVTDYALKPGESQIIQAGRNGEITVRYRLTYEDGQLVNKVEIGQEETATPVPEIIRKGDWERANAIRLAKPGNRKMASGPTGFCLARLLVCADCGGRVGRKNKTKGMTYLICENRACGFRTKTEPVVDAIKEVLSRNVLTRSDPIPPLESAGEALAEAVGASERRIADLSTRSERLADAVADGSQEAKKSLLATERAREEERLKLFNLVALLASLEPKLFEERKLALRAAIRDGDDVALNRILSQMVFRIELGESKATIHWKHSNEVTEVPFTYRNPKKRKTVPA